MNTAAAPGEGRGSRGERLPHGPAAPHAGRIGPNAITQCAAALQAALGEGATRALMRHAGLHAHVEQPPTRMVDERDVQALHRTLRAELGVARARSIGREAGLRTGDYLLAHRIPRVMRWLLPRLPAAMAARVLLAAVSAHAWTFCGSASFAVLPARGGLPLRVRIGGCASCRDEAADEPLGDFFGATFERLFTVLVHPRAQVRETSCVAQGAPACVFELRWR